MNMIIGISGKAGSGKDVIAEMLKLCEFAEQKRLTTMSKPQTDEEMLFLIRMIKSSLVHNVEVIRFADKIKDIVCSLIGCTRTQLEDRQFKETPLGEEWWYYKNGDTIIPYHANNPHPYELLVKPSPRLFLQQIGTECGRNIIHPNVWINATANFIKLYKGNCTFVIPDLRFLNEKRWIERQNGITIRVRRDNLPTMNHVSETTLDNEPHDYIILNNGTLYDLYLKVKKVYDKIKMHQ